MMDKPLYIQDFYGTLSRIEGARVPQIPGYELFDLYAVNNAYLDNGRVVVEENEWGIMDRNSGFMIAPPEYGSIERAYREARSLITRVPPEIWARQVEDKLREQADMAKAFLQRTEKLLRG